MSISPSIAPATTPRAETIELFLVRVTKYDDDGYPLRHWRGVLPTNSLACMHSLTKEVIEKDLLAPTRVSVQVIDETVQPVPERAIRKALAQPGTRVVLAFVGVQTNQFPRAVDLARRYRALGCVVLIGGFHVSGLAAMLPELPEDLLALTREGISLVCGEVETAWSGILEDLAENRLRAVYDVSKERPDLAHAPVPVLDDRLMKRFAYRHFATLETSRGCPFACSFCTIINVQGRSMRHRDPGHIVESIRENHRRTGTEHYFFTDDNMSRTRTWRELFRSLIELREREGISIRFLMQVDTLSHQIPDFIEMARDAGCFQVFLGMETLNPQSLIDGNKRQNRVEDFAALVDAWRRAGTITHVGYIIGFPHDEPASVRRDLHSLKTVIRPDLATFFMLTPLPGSADHLQMWRDGVDLDRDWNRYDTFHPVVDHPRMSRQEWFDLYRDAWSSFYSTDYMRERLGQVGAAEHTTLLQMYLWYKAASAVEGAHPMMSGFFRFKPRLERRPGLPIDTLPAHLRKRAPEVFGILRGYASLIHELQGLWSETRPGRSEVAVGRPRFTVARIPAHDVLELQPSRGGVRFDRAPRVENRNRSESRFHATVVRVAVSVLRCRRLDRRHRGAFELGFDLSQVMPHRVDVAVQVLVHQRQPNCRPHRRRPSNQGLEQQAQRHSRTRRLPEAQNPRQEADRGDDLRSGRDRRAFAGAEVGNHGGRAAAKVLRLVELVK